MTATEQAPKRPSPARILLQVTGFVVGCVLIAWCIQRAFAHGSGGLEKLRAAIIPSPELPTDPGKP